MAWVYVTIAAAFAQNLRFMLQKQLRSAALSTAGATFARFAFSSPLVWCLILIHARTVGQALPSVPGGFWAYALSGGLAQILATMCVVALFQHRNFAVGITFKKTEVLQTALVGLVVLGEGVSPLAALAVAIGFVGVVLLSDPPEGGAGRLAARLFNRASGLGLLSGFLFGISAVGYRGASLSLPTGDVILRAGFTLAIVTTCQTAIMAAWMALREPGEIGRVFRNWRVAGLVGVTSMIGSFCWFTAFTLQNAAYVKALGQVELIFSFVAGLLVFREKTSRREVRAIGLIVLSIIVLALAIRK